MTKRKARTIRKPSKQNPTKATRTPWADGELQDLLVTLGKSLSIKEATIAHNERWKTGRSPNRIKSKMLDDGFDAPGKYLKRSRRRGSDRPILKQVEDMRTYLERQKEGATFEKVCDHLGLAPKHTREAVRLGRAMGYDINIGDEGMISLSRGAPTVDRLAVHRLPIEPVSDVITFAAIADPHFASRLQRQECLEDFIDVAYHDFGVRVVTVSGDILAGRGMYPGQENEVYTLEGDRQVDYAVNGFPKRDGLTYKIIGGNHDASFYKKSGFQPTRIIAQRRDDIENYGWYSALVDLHVPGKGSAIKIDMYHPDKAGAYALSYHMQNAIRDIPPGMKPDLLLTGHEHRLLYLEERNVAGFLLGCFEDQTLYLKRKHKEPLVAGWILRIGVCKDGSPKSLEMHRIRYFHSRRGPLVGTVPGVDGDEQVRLTRSMGWPRRI